jgi:putative transposase
MQLRPHLGQVFSSLAQRKESWIEEGHLLVDHAHMLISILPKYAVSQVVGFIKGRSAIHLARVYDEKKGNFVGQHFWARGYLYPRSDGIKNRYGNTSRNRKQRTHAWSS